MEIVVEEYLFFNSFNVKFDMERFQKYFFMFMLLQGIIMREYQIWKEDVYILFLFGYLLVG